jgi:hydrogenase maturation factor
VTDALAAAEAAPCHDDVCITCSDQAVEVRIRTLLPGGLAEVDTGAGSETVSVALVDAAVGDLVLVHAKEAIARLAPVGPVGPAGPERPESPVSHAAGPAAPDTAAVPAGPEGGA